MSTVTRRSILQRLALLAATAVGALAPGSALAAEVSGSGGGAAAPAAPPPFTLFGESVQMHTQARTRGELPRPGDRLSMFSELLSAPGGRPVGEFHSVCFCSGAATPLGPFAGTALEMHTFNLPEGSIMGIGAGAAPGQEARFAIVGGTGKFVGARGHYSVRQEARRVGSAGAAEFHFEFIA